MSDMKDGEPVLAWYAGKPVIVKWDKNSGNWVRSTRPTSFEPEYLSGFSRLTLPDNYPGFDMKCGLCEYYLHANHDGPDHCCHPKNHYSLPRLHLDMSGPEHLPLGCPLRTRETAPVAPRSDEG